MPMSLKPLKMLSFALDSMGYTKSQSKHIIQLQAKLEALNETESQKMAT
jgi:hypothetical protein